MSGKAQEIGASYIPLSIGGDPYLEALDVVPQALFLCAEELSGKPYAQARDLWRWRAPTASESEILGITSNAGVVHLVHIARAEDDSILEISESVWQADRIEIIDEYFIGQDASDVQGLSDI